MKRRKVSVKFTISTKIWYLIYNTKFQEGHMNELKIIYEEKNLEYVKVQVKKTYKNVQIY